jgi:predicted RNase H-like HicB family nuclease
MVTKKDLKYYLNLNWSYTIQQSTQAGKKFFIIRINELPGVCTDAKTIEKGMKDIQEALAATIELYLEQGDCIPEPIQKEKYKGNLAYRTTSERHYHLARLAQQRHISMNKALDMIFDAGILQLQH